MAPLYEPRSVLYESAERNRVVVSYNLAHISGSEFPGYRLTLVFKNKGDTPILFTPEIVLQDASGFLIEPCSYDAYVSYFASLADAPMPVVQASDANRYHHSGTVTDTSGRSYRYSGHSAPSGGAAGGFATGFNQGFQQGAAGRAARERRDARAQMRWANQFWLKEQIDLPAGAAVVGAVFFPAPRLGQLPLKLVVTLGPETYSFTTVVPGPAVAGRPP